MEQIIIMNTENTQDDHFVEKPHVDSHAECGVLCFLKDIFSDVGFMDADSVRRNLNLGCKGGASEYDRSISMKLADDLLGKFGLIFAGLIVNRDYRDAFMEAVSVEIALCDRDEEFVRKIRRDMGEDTYGIIDHDHCYVIDLSSYDDEIFRRIAGTISSSFEVIMSYEEAVDVFAADLSEDDRIAIGYIASNFMYLIRAFAHNHLFAEYVMTVCETAASSLFGSDWE